MARRLHTDCCLWGTNLLVDASCGSVLEYSTRPRNSQIWSASTSIRSYRARSSRYVTKNGATIGRGLEPQHQRNPQWATSYQWPIGAGGSAGQDDDPRLADDDCF